MGLLGKAGLLDTAVAQYMATDPSMRDTAAQYPALASTAFGMGFKRSPADSADGRVLEYYPKGEDYSFEPNRPSIEVFGDVSPRDIAADIASHQPDIDPVVSQTYKSFQGSLSPAQQQKLHEQYKWAQDNAHEQRSYDDWESASGLPAAFRGYAFEQWPKDFNDQFYSNDQKASFDAMMKHLKGVR